MDHAEIRRKLSAYLDNAVSGEEKETIKRHLVGCGSCRSVLADLEWTVGQVKRLPEVDCPDWLTLQIMERVRAAGVPSPRAWEKLLTPLYLKLPLILAPLAAIGVAGWYFYYPAPELPFAVSRSSVPASRGGIPPAASPAPGGRSAAMPRGNAIDAPLPTLYPPPAAIPIPPAAQPQPARAAAPAAPSEHAPGLQPADEWGVTENNNDFFAGQEKALQRVVKQKSVARDEESPTRAGEAEVVLDIGDAVAAAEPIEQAITRAGGRIRGHSYGEEHVLFAQVDAQKLTGLLDRLARIGSLRERPAMAAGGAGKIDLVIRW